MLPKLNLSFSQKNKNQETNYELTVSNPKVSHTKTIKDLGILLDENLTYQVEVKNILKKMACGIKTLYSIRDLFPEKIRILLLNALVVSQLQYSSVLLNGIAQNLKTTLEKQLNCGIKAIFYKNKFDSSSDLKIEHKVLSLQSLLDLKMNCYFRKWENHFLPAYTGNKTFLPIRMPETERTEKLALSLRAITDFVKQSFFNRAPALWNTLHSDIRKQVNYEKLKKDLKSFCLHKYAAEVDYSAEVVKKCWREFRFY